MALDRYTYLIMAFEVYLVALLLDVSYYAM